MKGIVVTPEMEISVQKFAEPLYKSVGAVVGGWIEHVHPKGLPQPYCLMCNDNGLALELPINFIGSLLYGTPKHGYPIVGTIVLMKDGFADGEPDIVGLDDEDVDNLAVLLGKLSLKTSVEKGR